MTFCFCGATATDRCHVKSKGSGGTWDDHNIIRMCREHHVEQHKLGWNRFIERHHVVGLILLEKGWHFDEYRKKWSHGPK